MGTSIQLLTVCYSIGQGTALLSGVFDTMRAMHVQTSPITFSSLPVWFRRSCWAAKTPATAPGTGAGFASHTGQWRQSRQCRGEQVTVRHATGEERGLDRGAEDMRRLAEFLSSPTITLPGVGPKNGELLSRLGADTVLHLLCHLPRGLIDRTKLVMAADAHRYHGEVVSMELTVVHQQDKYTGLIMQCEDALGGRVDVSMWFSTSNRAYKMAQKAQWRPGVRKIVSGKIQAWGPGAVPEFKALDLAESPQNKDRVLVVEPVYPLTKDLSASRLKDFIDAARDQLQRMNRPAEWVPPEVLQRHNLASLPEALVAVHSLETAADLEATSPARCRIAFDEMLAGQLALLRAARHKKQGGGRVVHGDGYLVRQAAQSLPYTLTPGQNKAVDDVVDDMWHAEQRGRMVRMLTGDVGSGKTVVAFLSMLAVVEVGGQACLMAPSEILTTQHMDSLSRLVQGLSHRDGRPVRIGLLTSAVKGKAKEALLRDMANGQMDIVVGTNSLLNSVGQFKDLALAVVDEEQRFGVMQREALTLPGGDRAHVLSMSATPIPRTMFLALHGDMKESQLREMPSGTRPVKTTVVSLSNIEAVVAKLKAVLTSEGGRGDKVFWVVQRITGADEGASGLVGSAEERYAMLQRALGPERVALLHGKMSSEEQKAAMGTFADPAGKGPSVLVATSIIEVGVDIPQASVCIIENAEYFGLSQLHQIRGRVGRTDGGSAQEGDPGEAQGAGRGECQCVLLTHAGSSDAAKRKLAAMVRTRDGFEIAEEDLAIRGPGDMLGVLQKGNKDRQFRVAEYSQHLHLLDDAHRLAVSMLEDPASGGALAEAPEILVDMFRPAPTETPLGAPKSPSAVMAQAEGTSWRATAPVATKLSSITDARPTPAASRKAERPGGVNAAAGIQAVTTRLGSVTITTMAPAPVPEVGLQHPWPKTPTAPLAVPGKVDLLGKAHTLVVFDVETTGIGRSDAIIQLGAKVFGSQDPLHRFCSYVDPGAVPILPDAMKVHNITPELLRDKGARPFREVWADFVAWLGQMRQGLKVVLVAHNVAFDVRFLTQELERMGQGPNALSAAGLAGSVDSLSLLRSPRLWRSPGNPRAPPKPSSFKLGALHLALLGEVITDAHDAMADVLGLEAMLLHPAVRDRWLHIANDIAQSFPSHVEVDPTQTSGSAVGSSSAQPSAVDARGFGALTHHIQPTQTPFPRS